jgi:hypothetical protein
MSSIRLDELQQKMETLSDNDIRVLEALDTEIPTLPAELASELYVLPDLVLKSISKLQDLSFVISAKPTSPRISKLSAGQDVVLLTDIGKKVRALKSLEAESTTISIRRFKPKGRFLK